LLALRRSRNPIPVATLFGKRGRRFIRRARFVAVLEERVLKGKAPRATVTGLGGTADEHHHDRQ
jgi:hypothetical protein